ncbi:MAG: hypothetical protein HWE25_04535 [Alphaproteobacteria bacterium]|nr:hypothetical protein [Alphaproteobacteria bacterium]
MRQKKTLLRMAVAAGLLGSVTSHAAWACITPAEVKADQVRYLDMQLRVVALRCRQVNPRISDLYNAFVHKHRAALQASRKPVEGYLSRLTDMSMDSYVTKTANHISHHSMKSANFCALGAAVARLAATEDDPLVLLDLLPVSYDLKHPVCRRSPDIDPVTADAGYTQAESIQP